MEIVHIKLWTVY